MICRDLTPDLFARELKCLTRTRRATVEQHLTGCQTCTRTSRDARKVLSAVRLPDVEPPADGWERLATRIQEDLEAPTLRIFLSCSFCHDGLERAEGVYCAECLAPHHEDCFREHGACSTPGCSSTRVVRSQEVTPQRPRPRSWLWVGLGTLVLAAAAWSLFPSAPPPSETSPPPRKQSPTPVEKTVKELGPGVPEPPAPVTREPAPAPAKTVGTKPIIGGSPRVLPPAEPDPEPTRPDTGEPPVPMPPDPHDHTPEPIPIEPDEDDADDPKDEPPPVIYGEEDEPEQKPGEKPKKAEPEQPDRDDDDD